MGAPGLLDVGAGFAVGIVLSALGGSIAASATGYRTGSAAPVPLAVIVAGVVGLWVGLVAAVVFAARRSDQPDLRSFVGLRIAGWRDIVGGAAAGLASQYVMIPLLYLPAEHFDRSLAHQLSAPARQDTAAAHGIVAVTVLFGVLAVGAPVVEELFFRGLVLRVLAAKYRPVISVVVTALLFALAHFQAVQFVGLAAFGVVLGVLAWRTGRLAPSIAAHAAFNAAAVIAILQAR